MDSSAPGVHPQHALAVYAESLASGARVAVFGDVSLGLAAKLAELGARAVHCWDPDPDRARDEAERAPRGVTVRVYSEQEADLRPIDLAIVADLGLFADPAAIVRRVRRMVGEEGVAIIAARSAEAGREHEPAQASRSFDYYDLFDLVAPEFDSVRMVAQLPFYGVALVELGEEDEAPGVNVDTQLGESGKAPDAFVVVASQRGARLEPYTIVQLAVAVSRGDHDTGTSEISAEEARAGEREREAQRESEREGEREIERERAVARDREREIERERALARDRERAAERAASDAARAADREALVQAQLRTELLTGQLEDLRRRLAEGGRAADTVASLEEALRARSTQAMELESTLTARSRDLAELSSEVEEMRAAAEAGKIAAAQVEEVALRSDRAERRVAVLEQELAKGGDTQSRELADMEASLRERAQVVRSLEVELARREQMVRDLVGTLEDIEGRPAPASEAVAPPQEAPADAAPREAEVARKLGEENARLRAQLDSLALDLARREGEAQATAWQVTELERKLAQGAEAPSPRAPAPEADRRLAEALDQLDALRTALAQEHEARRRVESGDDLARARAEIQRQAVLMEQLVRELGSRPSSGFDAAGVAPGDPGSDSSEDSR